MNELAKKQKCISIRGGQEIWIDEDKVEAISSQMESRKFIQIGDNIINTADISGIYTAKEMENVIRRKNGQWQDAKTGDWHNRGDRTCSGCGQVIPFGLKCGNCFGTYVPKFVDKGKEESELTGEDLEDKEESIKELSDGFEEDKGGELKHI
jgi:hypothetical protein